LGSALRHEAEGGIGHGFRSVSRDVPSSKFLRVATVSGKQRETKTNKNYTHPVTADWEKKRGFNYLPDM